MRFFPVSRVWMASSGASPVSLRHGVRVVPQPNSTVEQVLLVVAEKVGHENISYASRMNKAVVVFFKDTKFVTQLIESGIVINDEFLQVSPLAVPSTRITVSGVPPFIPNEALERELRRFGKFASGFRTVGLGCKDPKLKHIQSLRRQVFMFLDSETQTLDVSFRVKHEEGVYLVYANSGTFKCFECGELGHKQIACPQRQIAAGCDGKGGEAAPSTDAGGVAGAVAAGAAGAAGGAAPGGRPGMSSSSAVPEVAGAAPGTGGPVGAWASRRVMGIADAGAATEGVVENKVMEDKTEARKDKETESRTKTEQIKRVELKKTEEVNEDKAVRTDEEQCVEMEEEQQSSQSVEQQAAPEAEDLDSEDVDSEAASLPDSLSQNPDLYSLDEINEFLEDSFGRPVDVKSYFPNVEKFIRTVGALQKSVNTEVLDEKKRYRLRKHVTTVKKALRGHKRAKKMKF